MILYGSVGGEHAYWMVHLTPLNIGRDCIHVGLQSGIGALNKRLCASKDYLSVSLLLSLSLLMTSDPFSIVRSLRALRRPKYEGHPLLSYEYEFPSWCVTALRRVVNVILFKLLGMTVLWMIKNEPIFI